MYIPDVINTILMGLIFMIIVVTVVRPLMLKLVGQYVDSDHLQKAMLEAIQKELTRASEEAEAKRAERIKYQMLLLETPEKPKLKPVVVPEPEPEPALLYNDHLIPFEIVEETFRLGARST
ncbi:MAG: hypothetical protein EB125_12430, partial [Betaproteobacteria bacterium]|nr:hypothetical protein [Betaproteobacteria bacterium]